MSDAQPTELMVDILKSHAMLIGQINELLGACDCLLGLEQDCTPSRRFYLNDVTFSLREIDGLLSLISDELFHSQSTLAVSFSTKAFEINIINELIVHMDALSTYVQHAAIRMELNPKIYFGNYDPSICLDCLLSIRDNYIALIPI